MIWNISQVPKKQQYFSLSTDTEYLKRVFPDCAKRMVFRVCYTRFGQRLSLCEYWNGKNEGRDPHDLKKICIWDYIPPLKGTTTDI